jgi:hypothetical protein
MNRSLAAAILAALSMGGQAMAHRVDEYLEAATIGLKKDRIAVQLRLTPGIAVYPLVMAAIDTDSDGSVSAGEQQAYANRVLRDLSLTLDGDPLKLRVLSATYPETGPLKEGLGEIRIDFEAQTKGGGARRLVFENRHQPAIGTYLVNCLEPEDPEIRVLSQRRNFEQTRYELEYSQPGAPASSGKWWWLAAPAILLGRLGFLFWRRSRRLQVPARD